MKALSDGVAYDPKYDLNTDGKFTAMDALLVINELNRLGCVTRTPTSTPTPAPTKTPLPPTCQIQSVVREGTSSTCTIKVSGANTTAYRADRLLEGGSWVEGSDRIPSTGSVTTFDRDCPTDKNQWHSVWAYGPGAGPVWCNYSYVPAVPQQCLVVVGWADASGYFGDYGGAYNKLSDIVKKLNVTSGIEALPTCLSQKIAPKCKCGEGAGARRACQQTAFTAGQNASVKYWGGCWFGVPGLSNAQQEQDALSNLLGVPVKNRDTFALPPPLGGASNAADAPYWYFDKSCNFVANPGSNKVCGFAGASWSPISLLLDASVGLHEDMRVVEFNLAGKEEEGFVLWKGSESAPLLVYDPKNTGKVKDAKQLFGSFAFGGKTKNVSDYGKKGYREPWKHGYEALALLDLDNDGKLSGKELDSLKLWSDKDRDGVSDDGEVLSLKHHQITSIFYREPTAVAGSKDVELTVGYERVVDGKSISGKSVDWFTETFSSKAEASAALKGMFSQEGVVGEDAKADTSDAVVSVKEIPESDALYKGVSANPRDNLTGYWVWTILEKGANKNPGIFVLSEKVDGAITGYTVSEAKLADNDQGLGSAMFAIPGNGQIIRTGGKEAQVKLIFRDRKAGGTSESIATMSEDGSMMKGRSTQRFEMKVGNEVQSAQVSYDWVATKTGLPPG